MPLDGDGLIPAELRLILAEWPVSERPRPKVLYTIPTGGNPSGASLTQDRKREIYSIAQEYGLLLLEDDPYYYLQFSPERVPSFLSMDVDGRLLRFDSTSKLVAAGIRLGWVTGPAPLVQRIELNLQAQSLHASALSQAILLRLFEHWGGVEGFLAHTLTVADFYKKRRDTFCCLADKHLKGLAEWSVPNAGMFIWMRVPGADDTESLIKEKAVEAKVLMLPGASFMPNGEKSNFVRASFSIPPEEDMDEALRRFAELLKQ